VKGRKRHVLVDCLGLVWNAVVTPANVQDQDGAILVLDDCLGALERLTKLLADSAYGKGRLNTWLAAFSQWTLEIVKALEGQKGFQVQPWRWIVERTFAWLGKFRRFSKDYEFLTDTSESMIYAAMTRNTVARLAKIK
jgi:putative transposase